MGTVGARVEQCGGELSVEHGRLVDDDEVGLDGILRVAGEGSRRSLRRQQPVQGARRPLTQLLQAFGGPPGRSSQGDPRAGRVGEAHDRGYRPALAGPRSAGEHAHPDFERGPGRVQLGLIKAGQDGGKIVGAATIAVAVVVRIPALILILIFGVGVGVDAFLREVVEHPRMVNRRRGGHRYRDGRRR